MPDIDFSEFREINNYNDKQPLYPFVEVMIGDTVVTDFTDDMSDTVMDFSYRRTAHQDATDVSGDSFTLTLYDDTAIEIESLIYNIILKTTHQAEEIIGDPNNPDDGTTVSIPEGESENVVDNEQDSDGTVSSFFRKGMNILGTPNDGTGDSDGTEDGGTSDGTEDNGEEKNQEEVWAEAMEQINNIDISYGWIDNNGNKFLDRSVHGNYQSYSMEFEGASAILTIEGTSLESGELNTPSSSGLNEFSAEEFGGVPSDIVVNIVDSIPNLKCNSKTIEETEPMLDENGNPKSFVRSGETYEEFIKKYLCEEAVSKRSGKVGYQFYVDKGLAYYKPNETPEDVEVETETEIKTKDKDKKNKSKKKNKNKKNKDKNKNKGSAKASDISKINTSGYDSGSKGVAVEGGTEFTDDKDDYDELDEFDLIDEDVELDEDDLPDDTYEFLGLSDLNEDTMNDLSGEELEWLENSSEGFESGSYDAVEYEEDDDSELTDEDISENDLGGESIVGEERPQWLRKFGIKLEL